MPAKKDWQAVSILFLGINFVFYIFLKLRGDIPDPEWNFYNYYDYVVMGAIRLLIYAVPIALITTLINYYIWKKIQPKLEVLKGKQERKEDALKFQIKSLESRFENFYSGYKVRLDSLEKEIEQLKEPPKKAEEIFIDQNILNLDKFV